MIPGLTRAFLAAMLCVLLFSTLKADIPIKFAPGLLHGSAPRVLIAELVPALSIAKSGPTAAIADFSLTPAYYPAKTLALQAIAGPLGASRLLNTTDDPNCNDLWGPDKWRHVGVWFAGTLGTYLFFKTVFKTSKLVSYLLSATAMSMVGLAREISDSNSEKNCFSEQDLLANTIGILAAGVVITIF